MERGVQLLKEAWTAVAKEAAGTTYQVLAASIPILIRSKFQISKCDATREEP
jgi:hypothetical protein